MGDKLSDIFILLLYQVFQIGDAQPPQKAHIGAQVFQTSLLLTLLLPGGGHICPPHQIMSNLTM